MSNSRSFTKGLSTKKYSVRFVPKRGVVIKGTITKRQLELLARKYQAQSGFDRLDITLAKLLDADAVITNHRNSIKWLIDLTYPKPEDFHVNA